MNNILLFLFAFQLILVVDCHDRPIIGIMMEPAIPEFQGLGNTYIAASYVKFIEGAGGRVAPIDYRWDQQKLAKAFQSINGVLFPGGSASLHLDSKYLAAQKTFLQLSIQAFDQSGDYFPVWGTCLGFEAISVIISGNYGVLGSFDAENLSLALNLTSKALTSRMFSQAPSEIIKTLTSKNSTMNNHQAGVSLDTWNKNPELTSMFNILSTNQDRKGTTFVSTIESFKYPVFGTQWHPEKPIYEWWKGEGICHSEDCVKANQYMANFFLSQARKNNHTYPSETEEWKALIYNYTPFFTYPLAKDFVQSYIFK